MIIIKKNEDTYKHSNWFSHTASFFVLDELFKGTNTVEHIAAGKAVLSYLNNENSIVLVSTHDVELARLLEAEGCQLHCFDKKVQDGKSYLASKNISTTGSFFKRFR